MSLPTAEVRTGDALALLREMPEASVQCVVTSPPYWGLRDYGVAGQLGLERTPAEYLAAMVELFDEVRRVLRSDGTLWMAGSPTVSEWREIQPLPPLLYEASDDIPF